MKESPISVSPACAGAILEGRKIMVRSVAAEHQEVCPFGGPGDRLWVREPWALVGAHPRFPSTDCEVPTAEWRPARDMPRELARIWLEIVSARRERLRSISLADISAEGSLSLESEIAGESPIEGFARWWDSLHHRDGTRWDDDPLVWVLRFRRI